MDAVLLFLLYSLGILAVSMVGACLPLARDLTDRQVHALVSFSAGIFVGLLFLLLLPEALEECEEGGIDTHVAMYAVLAGFLVILLVETWMKHRGMRGCPDGCDDADVHAMTSMSSFVGLSIHAACDGLALAASFLAGEEVGLLTAAGMCIHKFAVMFSLSSVTLASEIPRRRALKYLLGFGLITPVSGLAFFALLSGVTDISGFTGVPLAFAAGTFMYVALCDMLPEAFHRRGEEGQSMLLLILGILAMLAVTVLFPHTHRWSDAGLGASSTP